MIKGRTELPARGLTPNQPNVLTSILTQHCSYKRIISHLHRKPLVVPSVINGLHVHKAKVVALPALPCLSIPAHFTISLGTGSCCFAGTLQPLVAFFFT